MNKSMNSYSQPRPKKLQAESMRAAGERSNLREPRLKSKRLSNRLENVAGTVVQTASGGCRAVAGADQGRARGSGGEGVFSDYHCSWAKFRSWRSVRGGEEAVVGPLRFFGLNINCAPSCSPSGITIEKKNSIPQGSRKRRAGADGRWGEFRSSRRPNPDDTRRCAKFVTAAAGGRASGTNRDRAPF